MDKVRKRKKPEKYVVTPYVIIYKDDWYYMIGHSDEHDDIRTYRLDRMEKILLKREPGVKKEKYTREYFIDYVNRNFHMYGGDL